MMFWETKCLKSMTTWPWVTRGERRWWNEAHAEWGVYPSLRDNVANVPIVIGAHDTESSLSIAVVYSYTDERAY